MEKQINRVVEAVQNTEVKNFYFVACGGSMALFQPAHYIFDREIETPSHLYNAGEFVHRAPKALGAGSVVITCSQSGTTPETVRAAEVAREKGALTIGFSCGVDSPLWKAVEYPIKCESGKDVSAEDLSTGKLYQLTFGILNSLNPNEKYERALASIKNLQGIFERNRQNTLEAAKAFGREYRRENLIYTMGSGSTYGVAYSLAICYLMEIQWIHSHAIHSGEYFHGPFEVTDDDIPFIIFKGIDETRPLDERAHAFCKKFSDKLVVIDAADFDLEGIDPDLRGYFANLVAGAVAVQYIEYLSEQRGHPMSVRRYMWKMEY